MSKTVKECRGPSGAAEFVKRVAGLAEEGEDWDPNCARDTLNAIIFDAQELVRGLPLAEEGALVSEEDLPHEMVCGYRICDSGPCSCKRGTLRVSRKGEVKLPKGWTVDLRPVLAGKGEG